MKKLFDKIDENGIKIFGRGFILERRFFFWIVVPLIIAIVLFTNTYLRTIDSSQGIIKEEHGYLEYSYNSYVPSEFYNSNFLGFINKLFDNSLKISYSLCFKDTYEGERYGIDSNIIFDNQTYTLKPNEKLCFNLTDDKSFSYGLYFGGLSNKLGVKINSSTSIQLEYVLKRASYFNNSFKIDFWSLLAKILLFVLAWIGFWLLILKAYYVIREGVNKQFSK